MRSIFQGFISLRTASPRRLFITAGTCGLLFCLQRDLPCRQQQTGDAPSKYYGGLSEEQMHRSTVIQLDDPFERDYACRSLEVANLRDNGLARAMGLYIGAQALPYLLGAYLCYRAKLPGFIVPLASYFVYERWETFIEFQMLLTRVELLPDKRRARLTVGLFFPKVHTVRISETQQIFKYPNGPHRMNVFTAITEESRKLSFVRFDYTDPASDPLVYSNKGLFHDMLAGRQSQVDRYALETSAPSTGPTQ